MVNMEMLESNLKIANIELPMTEDDFTKAALMMEELKNFPTYITLAVAIVCPARRT